MRQILCIALFLGLGSNRLVASPLQLISGLPTGYISGAEVSFDVTLPEITNLGAYNIDLILESSSGTPGVDFFFDVVATQAALTHYVFPSDIFYFDAVNVEPPNKHRITLSDFDSVGVDVTTGSNDRVATVVFRTSSSFAQPLSLSVDATSLILDTPDSTPTPVDGFASIQSDVASSPSVTVQTIPEPVSTSLVMFGFLFFCSRAFPPERPWRRVHTGNSNSHYMARWSRLVCL